jgi:uncharacterized protein (DUF2252 family)
MIFDINEFDKTLPGPWEWDVKRLAASFEIMGRDRGFAPADRRAVVMAGVAEYPVEEYRYVHTAYKMVGVGSVGTRCYIMLMLGRDHNDPLFLQTKEAQTSVLERFVGKSTYHHHGQRVVAGQRLMQAATDIFLGWVRIKGLDGGPATTTCASSTTGRAAPTSTACSFLAPPCTRASAPRPSPAPTPDGATGSPSPPTWAKEMPSTGR